MSKKKFNGTEFVNQLLKNGWSMDGDRVYRSASNKAPQQKKRSKRTYDTNDHINVKNKAILHPFKNFLLTELNLEVWPEYYFTDERKFRIDFAIPHHRIAIEVDGGIWMRGNSGHSSGIGIKRDQEKCTLLTACGWRLIRVQPHELLSVKTIDAVRRAIENK